MVRATSSHQQGEEIAYYTTYEKRQKRNNHLEMEMQVIEYQCVG